MRENCDSQDGYHRSKFFLINYICLLKSEAAAWIYSGSFFLEVKLLSI